MYTSCWIGISFQMSTSCVYYNEYFLTSLTLYRSTLFDIILKPDYLQDEQRQLSLGFIFATWQFKDLFLQYKSQCLKKVNVKYVINRLWHEIYHIVPGISTPASLSGLIWESRADTRANVIISKYIMWRYTKMTTESDLQILKRAIYQLGTS